MALNQPDPELYASPTFRFRVGTEAVEFTVHSRAFTRLSSYFEALFNNGMQESVQGVAVWDDVDRETFLAFCQFAYTNSYETPQPDSRAPDPSDSHETDHENESRGHNETGGENETGDKIRLVEISGNWVDKQIRSTRSYLSSMHRNSAVDHPSTLSPHDDTIDISPVLRCHVALYILADRYLVDTLRSIALHKLHAILTSWTYGSESIRDMADIVVYAYSWTRENDPIRAILATFVATHQSWYIDRPEDEESMEIIREFQEDVKVVVDNFAESDLANMTEMFRLRP
ncbi:hypothetical protein GGR57DRAFT_504211 [Xylariaceae sp. FL1272]|nr:hypothetical protein GGR57DRAFT_504211 [Xylariaceae sp. FL1272]